MKCPKCEYLGFENSDRCRNCGYELSFAPPSHSDVEVFMRPPSEATFSEAALGLDGPGATALNARLNPDRLIGAPETAIEDLPLFGGRPWEEASVIAGASRPRAPLAVRRATPEIPRARMRTSRPLNSLSRRSLFDAPSSRSSSRSVALPPDVAAGHPHRVIAGLLDVGLLVGLDAIVLYFTLRLCGLGLTELAQLPLVPLAAFFTLLNGGYFVAFTAVGGQSIGKMALGIRIVSDEDAEVALDRAIVRTLGYLASALPLGAGFLLSVMRRDRLAFHDRLAHTRVVKASAT
jgi:uncharacterized RDD family membrane protein YckC